MYIDDAAILNAASNLVAAMSNRHGFDADASVKETVNMFKKLKEELKNEPA